MKLMLYLFMWGPSLAPYKMVGFKNKRWWVSWVWYRVSIKQKDKSVWEKREKLSMHITYSLYHIISSKCTTFFLFFFLLWGFVTLCMLHTSHSQTNYYICSFCCFSSCLPYPLLHSCILSFNSILWVFCHAFLISIFKSRKID